MRWPWQRTEATAVTDAASPVPPAGWAFLPPVQRQLAGAPPATLRSAFVSSLATRTLPTSLGTMGHLVDDGAPAGAIGVDDVALGPVQRAVGTELGLRHPPGRATAARSEPDVAVDDFVEEQVEVGGDVAVLEPVDAEDRVDVGVDHAAALAMTPETHRAAPGIDTAADAGAEAAAAENAIGPPAAAETGAAGEQVRSLPADTTAGEHPAMAVPPPPVQRRVGLGPPLSIATVQRSINDDLLHEGLVQRSTTGDGPARSMPVRGVEAAAHSPVESPYPPVESPSAAIPPEAPHRAAALARLPVDAPQTSLIPAPPTAAPTPHPTPPAPSVGRVDSPTRGTVASGPSVEEGPITPPLLQRTDAGPRSSQTTAPTRRPESEQRGIVQRQVGLGATLATTASARMPSASPAVAGTDAPTAQSPIAERADSPTADPLPPAVASADVEPPRPPTHGMSLRAVPLVAARTIEPALGAPLVGPASAARRRSGVVVARAIRPDAPAPTPPMTADTGTPARAGASAPVHLDRAGHSPAGFAPGGLTPALTAAPQATIDIESGDGRLGDQQPAVAASVSRSISPHTATVTSAIASGERTNPAAPVAQRAFGLPSLPSAPRLPSMPSVPSAPSMPNLPTMPDRPDLPSADELRERAGEAVPDLAERIPGGAEAMRSAADTLTSAGETLAMGGGAAGSTAAASDNVEQLVRRLYGPLVRRIKAELLLDRERRGIRIDGI